MKRLLVCLLLAACASSDVDEPGRLAADLPNRATFVKPSQVLANRCGSLDCHGSTYRNYRLFGYGGARLDPTIRPDTRIATTADENTFNYDATVAIEPERTVAIAQGREPVETSTLIRKGRGSEGHKGGFRLQAGTAPDSCVVGWLTGKPNEPACDSAIEELEIPK